MGRWLPLLLVMLTTAPGRTAAFLAPAPPRPSARARPPSRAGVRRAAAPARGGAGSPTAVSALPLPGLSAVPAFYKAFPLAAGFLTAGAKAAVADGLAQRRDLCQTRYDPRRGLAMSLYSGCVLGLCCEVMYNRVFPRLFGVDTGAVDLVRAAKMTLFDGFVNAPLLWLWPAYIAQALVYRYPKRRALRKYVADVRDHGLLTKYWSLWLPATGFNFVVVPPHFRVAFAASVSFFWMIVLSMVANKEQDVELCPVEPEPALLNPRALD